MHPIRWVPHDATSLLDVGCNVGELLTCCQQQHPTMRLAGIEINPDALKQAKRNLPEVNLQVGRAESLPFPEGSFDCVTCIEVLEHIPVQHREQALREIRRVLRPGGRFILRVPHAGVFSFLDSNNFRFRAPRLYNFLLGKGRRDNGFAGGSEDVVWHHHFTREEIISLVGSGWEVEAMRTGGLLLFPLGDIFVWPFYRKQKTDNRLYRAIHRVMNFDLGCDYGQASFDILVAFRRAH